MSEKLPDLDPELLLPATNDELFGFVNEVSTQFTVAHLQAGRLSEDGRTPLASQVKVGPEDLQKRRLLQQWNSGTIRYDQGKVHDAVDEEDRIIVPAQLSIILSGEGGERSQGVERHISFVPGIDEVVDVTTEIVGIQQANKAADTDAEAAKATLEDPTNKQRWAQEAEAIQCMRAMGLDPNVISRAEMLSFLMLAESVIRPDTVQVVTDEL